MNETLKDEDLVTLTVVDVFEAVRGWVKHSCDKRGTKSSILLDWKSMQAKDMLQHMKFATMGLDDLKYLAHHQSLNSYRDIIRAMSNGIVDKYILTLRHVPAFSSKRRRVVLPVTFQSMASQMTQMQSGDSHYGYIYLDTNNVPFAELFLLEKNRKEIRTVKGSRGVASCFGKAERQSSIAWDHETKCSKFIICAPTLALQYISPRLLCSPTLISSRTHPRAHFIPFFILWSPQRKSR